MFARARTHLSYANVMATVAVFIALGGGAWAAFKLPANSVKSKNIKDGQVKSADVADDGLKGADIDESSLGEVPSATDADTLDGFDSTGYAPVGSQQWTPLTFSTDVTFCHWDNYGNGFNPAEYFRDPAGVVHLRGLVKATNGTVFSCGSFPTGDLAVNHEHPLAAGHLPQNREVFTVTSNDKSGRVDVMPYGEVVIEDGYPAWADAKTWVSLDGISFRCGPAGSDGCPQSFEPPTR